MNDKDMARLRAEDRYDFGAWIGAAAGSIGQAFRVLERIQYGRPWNSSGYDGERSNGAAEATCRR